MSRDLTPLERRGFRIEREFRRDVAVCTRSLLNQLDAIHSLHRCARDLDCSTSGSVEPNKAPRETEKRSRLWSTMTVGNGSDLVVPGLGVEIPACLLYSELLKGERSRGSMWGPAMRIAE